MIPPPMLYINHHHEPARCPSCREVENVKTTCHYCGYEYVDNGSWFGFFVVGLIIFAVLFIFSVSVIILLNWMSDNSFGSHVTLWEEIVKAWDWVTGLRLW